MHVPKYRARQNIVETTSANIAKKTKQQRTIPTSSSATHTRMPNCWKSRNQCLTAGSLEITLYFHLFIMYSAKSRLEIKTLTTINACSNPQTNHHMLQLYN